MVHKHSDFNPMMHSDPGSTHSMNMFSGLFTKISFRSWGLLFLVASYAFLIYKLLTFNQYPQLISEWQSVPASRFGWLVAVFLILPLNWFIESLKWKFLTSHIQTLSIGTSVRAVLAGISTGFFTPNRVGELVGRVSYLEPDKRKAGVTLSLLSSLTQNMVMTLCGIPACVLFFASRGSQNHSYSMYYLAGVLISLLALGLFYFYLPQLSRAFKKRGKSFRLEQYTDCLMQYSKTELAQIILISILRYSVFCTQFYCLLLFFGVELIASQAFIAIPTSYLFVTFTPSFAFSEVAVRGSIAVLVIGVFCPKVVSIALAGMCIWLINFVLPMIAGSITLARKR